MKETIPQLVAYCQADPLFFEPVWRIPDDGNRFPAGSRPLPPGWRRGESELWVVLLPPDLALPEQGWKIHVSATDADASAVCDLVTDFCLARGIAVKFLRSRMAVRLMNNKYADRGSSGKLVTLYPVDEEQFAEVLPALAELLKGYTGPYILSDLRYEDSPVYVRYGAFQPMTYTRSDGSLGYAIRTPDGRLVPDQRTPAFTVPEWVTLPEVLRGSYEKHTAGGGEEFPYQIERALHFSNGGGVYLARDEASGGYVVLLEARPHAGLDAAGVDAVTRLARERDILERLSGLDCVPRLIGHRVIWEHHFLVEEYIEGKTLLDEVFERYPLATPDPAPETLAAYTRWAIDILAKVDHALMSIHARGVRIADLHPENIIVRPDGRIALIDFEIASGLEDTRPPGLAAAGFAAPKELSGRAADNYVLNCLRQWMFLPISPLQDRDPVKLASLTDVVTEHFPLPPGFAARMVRNFEAVKGPLGEDVAARMFTEPDWPAIRDSIAAGILASATPDRGDRLFPGDPQQFATGGFTVANGAAGVLWALRQAGVPVPEEHVDWLVTAVRRAPAPRPGLLNGLHGVAATLESLGRRDDALDVLDRARKLHDGLEVPGVHGGLAGVGLTLLHFFAVTGEEDLRAEAVRIADRLARELGDDGSRMFRPDGRVGLQHGLTGVASYFLRLHDVTGEPGYLDLARTALRREIGRGQTLPDGGFCLLDSNRYLLYLGTGSGGLALVLSQYLGRREEPGFADVIGGVRRALRAPFTRHPALLEGRAGTIATLRLMGLPEDRPLIDEHVRRLSWHALSYEGHLAFPGNQLLRLSMDLETGSAGVLAALSVAFNQSASVIPVLDLRTPAFETTERK
ncbi:serine/threonine protein kinase [Microbispora rosea subsp. aerata]|nr:class III lanthionine synthetase LanKC [Microbispora rosea]GGO16055.1 serine/threonine protein kinase [Microbispora rosea subsp. aerata]GIH55836.1 serine/threonine protein kinase [Microbispora rosea subsp. aerata]GLJ83250.1 serine/threonine protein kinase [Microbispora rosea subsp. aerata]